MRACLSRQSFVSRAFLDLGFCFFSDTTTFHPLLITLVTLIYSKDSTTNARLPFPPISNRRIQRPPQALRSITTLRLPHLRLQSRSIPRAYFDVQLPLCERETEGCRVQSLPFRGASEETLTEIALDRDRVGGGT